MRPAARRAQSLVETALVLPVLLLILMGTVEFGFYFYTLANINNAVRLGARAGASTALTDTAVTGIVNRALGYQAANATLSFYEFSPTSVNSDTGTNYRVPSPSEDVSGHPRNNGDFYVVKVSIPYRSMTRLVDLSQMGITGYNDYSTFLIYH